MAKENIIKCAKCGKEIEVQEEDILEDGEEVIEYYCESCGGGLIVAFLDSKKANLDYQREIIEESIKVKDKLPEKQYLDLSIALHTIGSLAVEGNQDAIELVCSLLKGNELDIPTKAVLVSYLRGIKDTRVTDVLIGILRTTKSDNRTRGLIKEILKTIASTERKELIEPLLELMDSKNFSYKMKNKVYEVIEILRGTSDIYYERL